MTWMFYTSMEGVNTMNNSLAVKMSQHTLRKMCLYIWSYSGPHFSRIFPYSEKFKRKIFRIYAVKMSQHMILII